MIDGNSYYSEQSQGRRIKTLEDVAREADTENVAYGRLFLPMIGKPGQSRIYEAACGPGILQKWLKNKGFNQVEGSDFSEFEATLASKTNPSIHYGDSLHHIETFGPSAFDTIIALDFYEHLPRESFRHFLKVANIALKPGGVLILRGPNGDSPFVGLNLYNDITHVWTYTTTCLGVLLKLSGFSQVRFDDDTRKVIYHGRLWKLPLMVFSQWLLGILVHSATRLKIRQWGMSLFVYAWKM